MTKSYDFHGDLQYRGQDEDYWKLDLAVPHEPIRTPAPVLVLVHGGGWRACDKRSQMESALVDHFATRGYAVASVEYRLTTVAPYPAQLSDAMCAVQFLRAHAEEYGLDTDRFAAAGHSAGGHLAALMGLVPSEEWWEAPMPHGDQSSAVQAVAGLSGAYHLDQAVQRASLDASVAALLPGRKATLMERARDASPATHVRADAPPFLLMHGTEDPCCPIESARLMAKALREAGARDVTLQELRGAEHCLKFDRIMESMDAFLDRVFLAG